MFPFLEAQSLHRRYSTFFCGFRGVFFSPDCLITRFDTGNYDVTIRRGAGQAASTKANVMAFQKSDYADAFSLTPMLRFSLFYY